MADKLLKNQTPRYSNISKLQKSLKKTIRGNVLWDREIVNYYSVDASAYQIIPDIVVIPKNERDVINIVKIARKYKVPVTVRGAGTGLVGSALNSGIIMDLKKFDSIKIQKNNVKVGAGTIKGNLDKALENKRKFFPPSPSVGPYCSIGGMIGNNSSGSRSLKYGSTIDNIEKITFVDGYGNKITLPESREYGSKIFKLSKKIDIEKFPKVTKNSSGYRLDSIKSIKDVHKIIVGSEGTLGIVLSADLKITPIPNNRVLLIVEYQSEKEAATNCSQIVNTFPTAIEFVDKTIMKNINHRFDKKSKCLLFVEYDSEIKNIQKRIKKIVTGKISKIIENNLDIQKWWKFRDSSLYYSSKVIKSKTLHVIEDATVPVERLPELFSSIKKINQKFHTKSIAYGHAGNGNIHIRLILKKKKISIIKKIANEYFDIIIKMGGTITGEHGDGLARSEYVKKQYGSKNYKLFIELKNQFDPDSILNPEKIITDKSMIIKNLSNY
ncbi:FAD binding domain protein [Candidatus Nitrosarchaeum limnium BG20]|jgi:glycolate oxidase|uniref:D-lactate dehydrogenase (cytochrome) n=2 Tax=Nitrosarchaeum TaxID=1007082 RepID=S2EIY1_9ARCH|nr:FAD-binding oxidoreductase [Candidatus Nitrosarchaeum limnium]EPA04687.1 FAD binding domain protein [Candidatus Nitrosarchaeum limnium BG20]